MVASIQFGELSVVLNWNTVTIVCVVQSAGGLSGNTKAGSAVQSVVVSRGAVLGSS